MVVGPGFEYFWVVALAQRARFNGLSRCFSRRETRAGLLKVDFEDSLESEGGEVLKWLLKLNS